MSFEGYDQHWCQNGHYWTEDCLDNQNPLCPRCRKPPVHTNPVDDTNLNDWGRIEPVLIGSVDHKGRQPEYIYKIPDSSTPRTYYMVANNGAPVWVPIDG